MSSADTSIESKPRVNPDATGPTGLDWILVVAIAVGCILETLLRSTAWPAASLAVCLLVAAMLPWRRTRPLLVAVTAFGAVSLVDLFGLFADVTWEGFYTLAFMLLVPYSLGRWGTNRQVLIVAPLMAVPVGLGAIAGEPWGDVIGGAVVLAVAVELGVLVRYRTITNRQQVESSRSREREQIARELHDTVAHHVSVIAVQAQAGRTLAPRRPEAAIEALEVIEEEASRALEQMRSMVGVLRDDRVPELAPQQGVADLGRLAASTASPLAVEIEVDASVGALPPAVDRAVYRLAQESITNAIRHARSASTVKVSVVRSAEAVEVRVVDDGAAVRLPVGVTTGYGLAGMSERVHLLDGEFRAGPGEVGGWQVWARLPAGTETS